MKNSLLVRMLFSLSLLAAAAPFLPAQDAPKNFPAGKWQEVAAKNDTDNPGGVLILPNGERFVSGTKMVKTKDGEELADFLICPNGQTFTSETAKGGPHFPYVSPDGSLVAILRQPATKTGMLYIYYKGADGKFQEVKDVNQKVVELLQTSKNKKWAAAAEYALFLDGMTGRTLSATIVDFDAPTKGEARPNLKLKLQVGPDGTISL